MTALFYQPQKSDQTVSIEKWGSIFKNVRNKGFDTLVVQWTQYGEFLSEDKDKEWLIKVLNQAKEVKLKLVIGLSADPEIFTKLKQAPAGLEIYLQKNYESDRKLLAFWNQSPLIENAIGWYIPLEVDDREWRDVDRRMILKQFLDRQLQQIHSSSVKDVYISSFFTGKMTPQNYAQQLADLKAGTQLKIWVQDGGGTKKLTASERELYLQDISDCKANTMDGLIYEIFKQTQHDQLFTAEPLGSADLAHRIKLRAPCKRDTLFFELRYLINLKAQ
jgi:hypothetical protein